MEQDLAWYIATGAKELGIEIQQKVLLKCVQYYHLLMTENQKYNLTTIVDEQEAAIKHFVDSFSLLLVRKFENESVLDLGSGAGFPGFPLAFFYDAIQILMVDSVEKKVKFLSKVVENLKLQHVKVLHQRAENMGQSELYRAKFDVVMSRAVASLPVLLEYGIPLLKIGGGFFGYERTCCSRGNESCQTCITGNEDRNYRS